ncbi:MAG: UDP-N-acetylglucosamine 2-epimerase [Myxococcales bacterium]
MRIAVLTTGRQDWGILRSVCVALRSDPAFQFRLIAGGMHYSARHGRTASLIEQQGFTIDEALPFTSNDGDQTAAQECGAMMPLLERALRRLSAQALLLIGDRFETLAAAMTAALVRVPVVHLHGGEQTQGAVDDLFRHAITKLSHLHFVSHPSHAARVVAMGEDPKTVHMVGAPGLDNAHRIDLPTREDLERHLGIPLKAPVVLVTLHPATLGDDPALEATAVAAAMDEVPATYVITLPNSDPGNEITRAILMSAAAQPGRIAAQALGEARYWALLRLADAVLGNSSSGLIEAPVYALPAVNVGRRQLGRLRGANVIDVVADKDAIVTGLRRALGAEFRISIKGTVSPYGDGHAGERIRDVLVRWTPPQPPVKAPVLP